MIDVIHRLTSAGAVLRNMTDMAVEREFVRATAPGFIIENLMLRAKGPITVQNKMPTAIKVQGGGSDGIIRNCVVEGFGEAIPGNKYDNGDGIGLEANARILIEDCIARGNVDGGIDSKGPGTIIRRFLASRNRYNFRFWDSHILQDTIISDAPFAAHIQIIGRRDRPPVIDLSEATFLRTGHPVDVLSEGGPARVLCNVPLVFAFKDGGALMG